MTASARTPDPRHWRSAYMPARSVCWRRTVNTRPEVPCGHSLMPLLSVVLAVIATGDPDLIGSNANAGPSV